MGSHKYHNLEKGRHQIRGTKIFGAIIAVPNMFTVRSYQYFSLWYGKLTSVLENYNHKVKINKHYYLKLYLSLRAAV